MYRCKIHSIFKRETHGSKEFILPSHSRAPVKSILYNTPFARANQFSINLAVELYRMDLEVYAHR